MSSALSAVVCAGLSPTGAADGGVMGTREDLWYSRRDVYIYTHILGTSAGRDGEGFSRVAHRVKVRDGEDGRKPRSASPRHSGEMPTFDNSEDAPLSMRYILYTFQVFLSVRKW